MFLNLFPQNQQLYIKIQSLNFHGVMVQLKTVLTIVAVLAVLFSGCTGGQDVTPLVKALPEVQQFLKEHPNAKITVTYWSKEDVEKLADEIGKQCGKPITPAAMYKAVISEGELRSIAWIDAATRTLICSTTEGKGGTPAPTPTATYTPVVTTPVIAQTSIPTPTPTPTPTSTPTVTPTPASISLPSSKTMTVGETWNLGSGYTLTTQSIDAMAAPRQVWIVFSKDGHKLDDKVIREGDSYAYGKIFSTKIASIYPVTNAEGVTVGSAARLENSILSPTSTPPATPVPTTPAPTPDSTSMPSSKIMMAGETWNLGYGYTLATPAIDALGNPRTVSIVFSRDGTKLDEKTLTEGNMYTYGSIFSAEIDSIFAGVQVGVVRLDNPALAPAPTPAQTVTATPVVTTPAPTPIIQVYQDPISYDFGSNWAGASLLRGVSIWNGGGGTLTWSASADQPWITPNPTSGTSSGWIAFNINTVGLSAGTHSGTITITSNGGTKTGIISLTVSQSLPTPTMTPAPDNSSSS